MPPLSYGPAGVFVYEEYFSYGFKEYRARFLESSTAVGVISTLESST